MQAEVNPLDHFNAKWNKNQLEPEITQFLSKIANDAGEAFTALICELVNNYADIITKPGKSIAQDIKHKTDPIVRPCKAYTSTQAAKCE